MACLLPWTWSYFASYYPGGYSQTIIPFPSKNSGFRCFCQTKNWWVFVLWKPKAFFACAHRQLCDSAPVADESLWRFPDSRRKNTWGSGGSKAGASKFFSSGKKKQTFNETPYKRGLKSPNKMEGFPYVYKWIPIKHPITPMVFFGGRFVQSQRFPSPQDGFTKLFGCRGGTCWWLKSGRENPLRLVVEIPLFTDFLNIHPTGVVNGISEASLQYLPMEQILETLNQAQPSRDSSFHIFQWSRDFFSFRLATGWISKVKPTFRRLTGVWMIKNSVQTNGHESKFHHISLNLHLIFILIIFIHEHFLNPYQDPRFQCSFCRKSRRFRRPSGSSSFKSWTLEADDEEGAWLGRTWKIHLRTPHGFQASRASSFQPWSLRRLGFIELDRSTLRGLYPSKTPCCCCYVWVLHSLKFHEQKICYPPRWFVVWGRNAFLPLLSRWRAPSR